MKEIGKLYVNEKGSIIVLCTGELKEKRTFCGTIVQISKGMNFFKLGHHSNTWSDAYFEEYDGELQIDNKTWEKFTTPGESMG